MAVNIPSKEAMISTPLAHVGFQGGLCPWGQVCDHRSIDLLFMQTRDSGKMLIVQILTDPAEIRHGLPFV